MLKVKKLDPKAVAPTVANPGEDLAYDLYALEDTTVRINNVTKVRTGIAVACIIGKKSYGLLIRDRSSMAAKGIATTGGVVDSGYRGEVMVLLNFVSPDGIREKHIPGQLPRLERRQKKDGSYTISAGGDDDMHGEYLIKAGDKIAQMIPVEVLTGDVEVVDTLPESVRKEKGFGSSGN